MSLRKHIKGQRPVFASLAILALALTSCGDSGGEGSGISGEVNVDGSSTVYPISQAMAEEFGAANRNARVTVSFSGSGGGFKKFCNGEIDISNASRPIKQKEIDKCAEQGIEFIEIPVAYDGLSVVVNKDNNWAACLTAEELGKMWEPAAEGKITAWNQVKGEYPNQVLRLYGPGTDSGTYDYFTEATIGDAKSRTDFTASEDDNALVQGVNSDKGGMAFFGYAYYEENKGTLQAVAIKNADGACVKPSAEAIADGSYNPLSRPIFFYVSKTAMEENPAVKAFAEFQTNPENSELISEVGYIPLPGETQAKVQNRLANATTGSIYGGGSSVGVKLSDKL